MHHRFAHVLSLQQNSENLLQQNSQNFDAEKQSELCGSTTVTAIEHHVN